MGVGVGLAAGHCAGERAHGPSVDQHNVGVCGFRRVSCSRDREQTSTCAVTPFRHSAATSPRPVAHSPAMRTEQDGYGTPTWAWVVGGIVVLVMAALVVWLILAGHDSRSYPISR